MLKIAVLALQGGFIEHEKMLLSLSTETIELRKKEDLLHDFDALVLPGGESTVQGKLLKDLDMLEPIREKIKKGMPVLATCAGLILLAESIVGESTKHLGTMPVRVKRNAYGRQLGSFCHQGEVKGLGKYSMEFIRAPYVQEVADDVEVLSVVNGKTVGVRYKNQFGFAFHPELTEDARIHKMLLDCVKE